MNCHNRFSNIASTIIDCQCLLLMCKGKLLNIVCLHTQWLRFPNIVQILLDLFFMCTTSEIRFNDPIKVICWLEMVEYSFCEKII